MCYAREAGLDRDNSIMLWQALRQMDEADLEWTAKAIRRETDQGTEDDG